MLNEIFKGMDNAAEQIDENFQFGSIEELNIGENSGYIKYANGFLVCFGFEGREYDSISVGGIIDIDLSWPVRFIDPPFPFHSLALALTSEANMKNYDSAQQRGSITTDGMTVTVSHNGSNQARTSLTIYYLAIGRWK